MQIVNYNNSDLNLLILVSY